MKRKTVPQRQTTNSDSAGFSTALNDDQKKRYPAQLKLQFAHTQWDVQIAQNHKGTAWITLAGLPSSAVSVPTPAHYLTLSLHYVTFRQEFGNSSTACLLIELSQWLAGV